MKIHTKLLLIIVALCVAFATGSCNTNQGTDPIQDVQAMGAVITTTTVTSIVATPAGGAIVGFFTWLVMRFFQARQDFEVHGTLRPIVGAPSNPEVHGLAWYWWILIAFAVVFAIKLAFGRRYRELMGKALGSLRRLDVKGSATALWRASGASHSRKSATEERP